jgi:hypothetical protein
MAFPYKTISTNTDSLNTGSFYEQTDLDNVLSGSIPDVYFGLTEQDIIEFSIYDIDGNLKGWKPLSKTPIYNVLNKTYKNVDSVSLSYTYKKYSSGYKISSTNKKASRIIHINDPIKGKVKITKTSTDPNPLTYTAEIINDSTNTQNGGTKKKITKKKIKQIKTTRKSKK